MPQEEEEAPEKALEEITEELPEEEEAIEEIEAPPPPPRPPTVGRAYGAIWGFVGAALTILSVPPPDSPFKRIQYFITLTGTAIFTFIFIGLAAWALHIILRRSRVLSASNFIQGYVIGAIVMATLAYGLNLPNQVLGAGGYPSSCSGCLFMLLPIADLAMLGFVIRARR